MLPLPTGLARPGLKCLAAILAAVAAAAAQIGSPATGVLHYTRYQSGVPNVLKVEYTYDGGVVLDLAKPVEISSVRSPMGIVKQKGGDLLVASPLGYFYSINAGTGTATTQAAMASLPATVALTTSETAAWATNIRGEVFQVPLAPLSTPVPAPIQGAEVRLHSLYFRTESIAYYAADMGSNVNFILVGELDTRTMVTTRWLQIAGRVAGVVLDPYTRDLMVCGGTVLYQVDTTTRAVKATLNSADTKTYISCAVDGEGHILLTDVEGRLHIIDYSQSRMLDNPGNPTAERRMLDPIHKLAPLTGPGAIKIKPAPMKGLRASYGDANGDGRIDEAILELPRPSVLRPASLSLIDPFSRLPRIVEGARAEPIDAQRFRIAFPEAPMDFGTVFAPGPYAGILADALLFDTAPFEVRDGVGPQLGSAESVPPQRSGDRPVVDVTFSEPIRLGPVTGILPFKVLRDGVDMAPQMRLHGAASLGNNAWRFEFASADFPKGGDSIVVTPGTPLLTDEPGNLSNQVRLVPVKGAVPPVFVLANSLSPVAQFHVPPGAPPVNVLLAADHSRPLACLNCPQGPVQQALQVSLQTPSRPGFQAWLFTVRTLGPFRYDLAIYSHLGQYIGRVSGVVDGTLLARTAKDKEGASQVRLYWWPVTESGSQARTGAYIARGVLSADPMTLPSPTEPGTLLQLPGKAEKVSLRFGRL